MKTLRWIVIGCVLMAVVPALAQAKASDELKALVDRIDAQYAQIKDFQADYVQETRIQGFDTPVRSSGRVYLKKPGRLRWDYLEPSVEHIYVYQDQVAMYVPAHNQVLKGSLTMMVSTKAPVRLLQGVGKTGRTLFHETHGRRKEGRRRVAVGDADPQAHCRCSAVVARQDRSGNPTANLYDSRPHLA